MPCFLSGNEARLGPLDCTGLLTLAGLLTDLARSSPSSLTGSRTLARVKPGGLARKPVRHGFDLSFLLLNIGLCQTNIAEIFQRH